MNSESVARIVALNRQIAALVSMRKRGDLTADECEIAQRPLHDEIAAIRSQKALLPSAEQAAEAGSKRK